MSDLHLPEWRCVIPPTFAPGTPYAIQRVLGDPRNLNGYYVRAASLHDAIAMLSAKHRAAFTGEFWKPPLYPLDTTPEESP